MALTAVLQGYKKAWCLSQIRVRKKRKKLKVKIKTIKRDILGLGRNNGIWTILFLLMINYGHELKLKGATH